MLVFTARFTSDVMCVCVGDVVAPARVSHLDHCVVTLFYVGGRFFPTVQSAVNAALLSCQLCDVSPDGFLLTFDLYRMWRAADL